MSSIRTLEVIHETGLCSNHPLSPGLTEDGDVGLWFLAQHLQPISKVKGSNEDIFIGKPIIVPQNNLIKQSIKHKYLLTWPKYYFIGSKFQTLYSQKVT